MCGIAGIIGTDVPEINVRLAKMSESIAHRGPDASGSYVCPQAGSPQVALTHRRLSIIDLSEAGRQPMYSCDGRYSIVFNGEIYNYLELRSQLLADGVDFRTNTDTEVLLKLYELYGEESLGMLRGMFALAIHDRHTGGLFFARDRLGIKPLYYYEGNRWFVFASEMRALLASGLIPSVLDPVSMNSYLSFGAIQEPRTIVDNVRALPPAHYMKVDSRGEVKAIRSYWALPQEKYRGERADAIAETRRLLEESIKLHLVSDVPLGVFLSSGVDSSSIVALVSKYAPGRVRTLTVCFDENKFDERDLARRVADRWGTAHAEVELPEREMLKLLPEAMGSIDQPTIDGINTWIISRAARQAGLTVALSGLGGDELFGGYPSFRRAMRLHKFVARMGWVKPSARNQLARFSGRLMGDSLRAQKIASALSAGNDLLTWYASMRGLFSREARTDLLNATASINAETPYYIPADTLDLIKAHGGNGDVFNQISKYEMCLYMSNMLLRDTDAMSMASSLEVRVPLLDHKLLEWVYALPGHMKMGDGPKPLLVEAMGGDLLPEVTGRRKMGFTLPFERWLHTALKPFASEVLGDSRQVARTGLNPSATAQVLKRFSEGSRSTSWSRVWGLVVLVDWCRRHKLERPH